MPVSAGGASNHLAFNPSETIRAEPVFPIILSLSKEALRGHVAPGVANQRKD
jgi:hypothetical protein